MSNALAISERSTALAAIETAVRKERRRLTSMLPAAIPAARAIETVIAAARKTPELQECTPESFVFALRESARWGLIPDGIMGQGYLIPRRNGKTGEMEAHFQAGYRGLEDLARRSGQVSSIISGWHSTNDPHFVIRAGFTSTIEHEPALSDPGDVVGFYAGAWLNNGAPPVAVYMTLAEVIAIRNAVPYWNRGPWAGHFNMMGRKTVVRRLIPQLPLSADLQAIVALDEAPWEKAVDVTPVPDGEAPESTKKARRMRAVLERRSGGEEAETPQADDDGQADGSSQEQGARAEGVEEERAEASEVVTGTVRIIDRVGLDGGTATTPSGPIVGFRLDVDPDEWMQVVLSGQVYERYAASDRGVVEGDVVTVTGGKVVVPRPDVNGAPVPPVIRIIATEDIQWQQST